MTNMKAVIIHNAGGPDVLKVEERPVPDVKTGWVLVRVRAFVDAIEAGTANIRTGPVFSIDDIVDAHRTMEEDRAAGKIVVVT